MQIGYRVVSPEEVGRWETDLIQISAYRGGLDNVDRVRQCARACREKGLPFVVHPVSYSLLDAGASGELLEMAELADRALILHDEKGPSGKRLHGQYDALFRQAAGELSRHASLSFENATDTADAVWFWDSYADSVTLDIGHAEAAGFDSVEFVAGLSDELVGRIRYVHMHRNGELRGGLTDHWPLMEGCRELRALKALLDRNPDVSAILEINETEQTGESLRMLRELSDRVG
jgi:sugar phosphate isomerase/epimerase